MLRKEELCAQGRFNAKSTLQSFFTRWWAEQSEETQSKVKKLVEEGRLSFINGGWVQHDEAAAHYVAMIDQTTRGHRSLQNLH